MGLGGFDYVQSFAFGFADPPSLIGQSPMGSRSRRSAGRPEPLSYFSLKKVA
jgi:hypothetical protein